MTDTECTKRHPWMAGHCGRTPGHAGQCRPALHPEHHAPGCTTAPHPGECAPELDRLNDPHDCEPTDDGTACRICGLPAERADLTPDALLLLTDPATVDPGYRESHAARWSLALNQAAIDRRARARREYGTLDGWREPYLAQRAAAYGLVPVAHRYPDDAQRQRELGDVWAHIESARAGDGYSATNPAASGQRYYESHDGHSERDLLAGRHDADGHVWHGWPPIYAVGLAAARPSSAE